MSSTRTRVIGTTRIEEPVAMGGMAELYRGSQRSLGRAVAVKVMLPKLARDRDMVQRFRREALTLATLQHENIVAVHDLIEKNRQVFMVLEYVDGLDAARLIPAEGGLPLDIALIIAASVSRALEHAHFRRVIHRDIKPSNVMISKLGEVKLADFGIAKDLADTDLTSTGMVVGTPSYVPPEVLKGRRADHRADLYATGVLLFECVTGQRPFSGESPQELYAAIAAGQRDKVRALAPSCPRAVEKIVDRCLERDPERRYQSASELRRDLEHQLDSVVAGSPAARLVGYLYSQRHIAAQDLATVDIAALTSADPSLEISISDLDAAASAARSIDVDLADLDVAGERMRRARRTRRWPRALLAALALALTAGALAYAMRPDAVVAALQQAIERARALLSL